MIFLSLIKFVFPGFPGAVGTLWYYFGTSYPHQNATFRNKVQHERKKLYMTVNPI